MLKIFTIPNDQIYDKCITTIFSDIIMPKFHFIVFDMEDEINEYNDIQNLVDLQKYIIKILKPKKHN